MRGRTCRPKIIYIPRWGIDCAGKGPISGGGVEIAAPGIENGLNAGAVTPRSIKMLEMT
jgi:hypothetical protein